MFGENHRCDIQRKRSEWRDTPKKPTNLQITGVHRKLSPGLLLVTCPHRRSYGFRIMKTPESVRDIFQVLLTRLGNNPPSTIIYDNSCMLAAYSLAREPNRFANVRFLIDRFHHTNHKACSQALRIRSYQTDPVLSGYNTQACEQTNSLLRHLGNSLPFMSLPRYTKTIILFLSRNWFVIPLINSSPPPFHFLLTFTLIMFISHIL